MLTTHVHTRTQMHTRTHMCNTYTRTHVHMCTHVHAHTHTQIRAHTNTHLYTQHTRRGPARRWMSSPREPTGRGPSRGPSPLPLPPFGGQRASTPTEPPVSYSSRYRNPPRPTLVNSVVPRDVTSQETLRIEGRGTPCTPTPVHGSRWGSRERTRFLREPGPLGSTTDTTLRRRRTRTRTKRRPSRCSVASQSATSVSPEVSGNHVAELGSTPVPHPTRLVHLCPDLPRSASLPDIRGTPSVSR